MLSLERPLPAAWLSRVEVYQENSEVCQMVAQTRGVFRGAVVLPAAVAVPASPSIYSNTISISSYIQTK